MDNLGNYRRRNYSAFPNDLDFDEISEEVKKFGSFKNVTFYVTEGPYNLNKVRQFITELSSRKITLLACTNRNNYDHSEFQSAGITILDLSFNVPSCPPEEPSFKDYHDFIKTAFLENKRVAIGIQGYEEGAYVIVISLMVMGMSRVDALDRVREFEGEVSLSQMHYLRWREDELQEEYKMMLSKRRSRGFFPRLLDKLKNMPR